jgi:hypothetical protein
VALVLPAMAAARLLRTALLTAFLLALADERVRGSVGLLNEPVSTYAVTGLDVCFSQNTAAPRKAVNVTDPSAFTVTLRSPSGETHAAAVEVPFGRPNCLVFDRPLVLTEPGQYLVDLVGSINGTTFDVKDIEAGGEVIAREQITFPTRVSSDEDLEARIAALEADGEKGIPAPAAALTFALLAVLAAVRRLG